MITVAKILLFDAQGNVLALTRGATHPLFPDHADLPGGEAETGENPAKTAVRELTEETKLTVDEAALSLLFDNQPNEMRRHLLYTAKLNVSTAKVMLSWEHSAYEWIPYARFLSQKLPSNADPYYRQALSFLKDNFPIKPGAAPPFNLSR